MNDFKKFTYCLTIKEHHLDTFSHVNNATYLEILEEARWEFLNTHGFDLNTIQKTKIGPVVLECNIKFLKELRVRQNIIIESQIISYDKKIGKIKQEIINSDGELFCQAELTFGMLDMVHRKLILPSAEWLLTMQECV